MRDKSPSPVSTDTLKWLWEEKDVDLDRRSLDGTANKTLHLGQVLGTAYPK